jgi:hypothetical protein
MIDTEISTATAARAREGAVLTDAELLYLDAADVLSLGMLADEVRRARVGDAVVFSRVLEVGADGIAEDEGTSAALAAAHEVRLIALGTSLAATADAIGGVRARVGAGRSLTGFSLADIVARGWGALGDVLAALKAAGLDAIVEAAVDTVTIENIGVVVEAGLGPSTLSVQKWPGEGSVALIARVREFVTAYPSLRRFAPLAREQSVTVPTTGYHDVRLVALARLALPSVPELEIDWQQYGPKLAQVALMFGANRLDRVSPVDDPALGLRRATAEEVRRNITAAGFRPAEPSGAA